jgi:biopolymer transport protein ExbD
MPSAASAPVACTSRPSEPDEGATDMGARLDLGNNDDLGEVHEINVTPFIDVILVLLIIFMIAAPLATVDIPVDLPSSNAQQQPRPEKPLFLTLKSDMSITLGNDQTVDRTALGSALAQATNGDKEQRLFVRADKSVAYGDLMTLMNDLRSAGYLKIALVGLEAGQAK